jgi:hypothetical protein
VGEITALRSGRPLLPWKIPDTYYREKLSRPQGHNAVERITSVEKSVTSPEIEPVTFRLSASVNYAIACPQISMSGLYFIVIVSPDSGTALLCISVVIG